MTWLKQLISDGEQPSTGRVIVLTIVLPIMGVWMFLSIRKGEFVAIPWQTLAALLGAVLGKTGQSFAEAITTPAENTKTP